MQIFLENKTLFLPRPAHVKLVQKISGLFLEVGGQAGEIEVSPEQLVNDFSGIKKERDVEAFAYKYGKLVSAEVQLENVNSWLKYAGVVRNLMELRRAYVKKKSLLDIIGVNDTHFIWVIDNSELCTPFREVAHKVWFREERLVSFLTHEEGDEFKESYLRMMTPLLILNEITPGLDVRIDFAEPEIISDLDWKEGGLYTFGEEFDENNTRYVPKERKYAPTLVSAIYYSLWGIMNTNRDIQECDECKRPTIVRRQREHIYCGAACKKKAERKRKEPSGT